jgi:hypothetical protein
MTFNAATYSELSASRKKISAEQISPMPDHAEGDFETAIEAGLTSPGGLWVARPE